MTSRRARHTAAPIAFGAIAAFVPLACNPTSSSTGATPPPVTLAIQAGASGSGPNKAIAIATGDTVSIVYAINDIFGRPVPVRPDFFSRDTRVALVSRAGLISGNSPGTTYVTAFVATSATAYLGDSVKVTVAGGCTQEARAGLVISVEDSLTGSKGPFSAVSYVAHDTSVYKDSTLIASVSPSLSGAAFLVGLAFEHPGKFNVTVRATGYRPWIKTGVAVATDKCHVIPVSLTARFVGL